VHEAGELPAAERSALLAELLELAPAVQAPLLAQLAAHLGGDERARAVTAGVEAARGTEHVAAFAALQDEPERSATVAEALTLGWRAVSAVLPVVPENDRPGVLRGAITVASQARRTFDPIRGEQPFERLLAALAPFVAELSAGARAELVGAVVRELARGRRAEALEALAGFMPALAAAVQPPERIGQVIADIESWWP
jgi:hypothetical protein